MKTQIQTRNSEIDDLLRRYIFNSIQSALLTLAENINAVFVKLHSVLESSGTPTKICSIEIHVQDATSIVAKGQTTHWFSAIDQAIHAAARAARRQVNKTPNVEKASLLVVEK